ncbi:MAG: PD40 domain-containing protein, partial [Acidobacteriia bacterium]|nr:PD40 domain-containing protein [Terriglobia bacterium]
MLRGLALLFVAVPFAYSQKPPFDVNALLSLRRISDPQISPDGRWVTFTVRSIDVAANKRPQAVWIVPLQGGTPHSITRPDEDSQRARWSPDSKHIAFVSDRGGSQQIWMIDPEGG